MTTTKYASFFPAVAPRSTEIVQVIVHGASNVPTIQDRLPNCYVTICNQSETIDRMDRLEPQIQATPNATNSVESDSPIWNEILIAQVDEDFAHRERLVLYIIDEPTQRLLVQYTIPWSWLIPFYQYHLNLQSKSPTGNQPVSLYLSLMKKLSTLHKDNSRYFGLETVLDRFDVPLTKNISCYAVARVVPDYERYRAEFLDNTRRRPVGIQFQRIREPNQQDFILPQYTVIGYPQVSLATRQSQLPYWKHNFFFTNSDERNTMFGNREAALVLEFYNAHPIANNSEWSLNSLIGRSAIRLDSRARDALISQVAVDGMRTEGLLIEHEGDLMPETAKYPSVRVFLRLLGEKHPVKNLLTLMNENLPVLPSYQNESQVQGALKPVYKQAPSTNRTQFPPLVSARPPGIRSPINMSKERAVVFGYERVRLMPYVRPHRQQWMIVPKAKAAPTVAQPIPIPIQAPLVQIPTAGYPDVTQAQPLRFHPPRINPYDLEDIPPEYRNLLLNNYPPRRDEDIDGWFDYFQREVAMYKQAIRRILQDVKELKDDNQKFSSANESLKKQVDIMEKKKKVLYEVLEGDKIDKNRIQKIIEQFENRIASQKRQMREDQLKIEKFEKELAARSQLREEYERLYQTNQALELQMKMLQERVSKADGLEETVRRQELVIERLEAKFQSYMKEKRARGALTDLDRTFLAEHAALGLDQDENLRSARKDRKFPAGSSAQSRVKFATFDEQG